MGFYDHRILFSSKSLTVALLSPDKRALGRLHRIKAIRFFDNRIKHLKQYTPRKNGFYSLWKFETHEEKKLFIVTLTRYRHRSNSHVELRRPASKAKSRYIDKTAVTPAQKRKPVWIRFRNYRWVCWQNRKKRLERIKQQREALKRRVLMLATEQKARDLARFAAISDLI